MKRGSLAGVGVGNSLTTEAALAAVALVSNPVRRGVGLAAGDQIADAKSEPANNETTIAAWMSLRVFMSSTSFRELGRLLGRLLFLDETNVG
jgi:hypothetical protein